MISSRYDIKCDIWGLGCIFYELVYMFENIDSDPHDRFLFQGTSCYPLSPTGTTVNKKTKVEQSDQLIKIIETVGPIN